ncbi:MAG: glycerol-3-phosphate acyltransferase [Candidatus Bathyarchaeota archaeon]|nr:glycerol-3-phosphate acyltransferase [Candidatus Bathyarchaeota archaeon]
MTGYLWVIFSYLLTSIPNGYLVTKWLTDQDIRDRGRKKLSGSNIIHNAGLVPGLLSGFLDVLKGVFTVWGAFRLGFPESIQVLSGLAALCGQMWPIFFKFWGGRGGSVLIAILLILSPRILSISAVIFLISKILSREMGAPIGMILFGISSIILASYSMQSTVIIFGVPALVLIFLQRLLGKPGSLLKIKDKKVILWRLILDRDTKERLLSEREVW